jgi:hypothetical protein
MLIPHNTSLHQKTKGNKGNIGLHILTATHYLVEGFSGSPVMVSAVQNGYTSTNVNSIKVMSVSISFPLPIG